MEQHEIVNNQTAEEKATKLAETLKSKNVPKTAAERQKPFYYIATVIGLFAQVVSFTLAASGVMYMVTTKLGATGFLLVALSFIGLVLIETLVWKSTKLFHAARLDDKNITIPLVVALVLSYSASTPLTFVGTPYAISFFSAQPSTLDLNMLALAEDTQRTRDSLFISNQLAATSASLATLRARNSRDNGTTRSSAVKTEQQLIKDELELNNKLTATIQEANKRKETLLANSKAENEVITNEHILFCQTFGSWLAWITVIAMVVLFVCRWWVEGWERDYVKERENKQNLPNQTASTSSQVKHTKVTNRTKQGGQTVSKGFQVATAQARTIQIPNQSGQNQTESTVPSEPYHGLIFRPEGATVDHVYYENKHGDLTIYRQTDIARQIAKYEKKRAERGTEEKTDGEKKMIAVYESMQIR